MYALLVSLMICSTKATSFWRLVGLPSSDVHPSVFVRYQPPLKACGAAMMKPWAAAALISCVYSRKFNAVSPAPWRPMSIGAPQPASDEVNAEAGASST